MKNFLFSKYNLQFDEQKTELAYRQYEYENSVGLLRFYALMLALVYSLSLAIIFFLIPEPQYADARLNVYLLLLPAVSFVSVAFFLSYTNYFSVDNYQIWVTSVLFVGLLTVVLCGVVLSNSEIGISLEERIILCTTFGFPLFLAGVLLTSIVGITNFIGGVVYNVAALMTYYLYSYLCMESYFFSEVAIFQNVILATLAPVGMYIAYAKEKAERLHFVHEQELENAIHESDELIQKVNEALA